MTAPVPISDDELAHLRMSWRDSNRRGVIARLDQAERKLEAAMKSEPISTVMLEAAYHEAMDRLVLAEAEVARLRAVVEAAKKWAEQDRRWCSGERENLPRIQMDELKDALAALTAPPDPEEGS